MRVQHLNWEGTREELKVQIPQLSVEALKEDHYWSQYLISGWRVNSLLEEELVRRQILPAYWEPLTVIENRQNNHFRCSYPRI